MIPEKQGLVIEGDVSGARPGAQCLPVC
jgi:hypothetical protein